MSAAELERRQWALMALSLSDFYGSMIRCRSSAMVRSSGLRMKTRAIVGHDRVLAGRRGA